MVTVGGAAHVLVTETSLSWVLVAAFHIRLRKPGVLKLSLIRGDPIGVLMPLVCKSIDVPYTYELTRGFPP